MKINSKNRTVQNRTVAKIYIYIYIYIYVYIQTIKKLYNQINNKLKQLQQQVHTSSSTRKQQQQQQTANFHA